MVVAQKTIATTLSCAKGQKNVESVKKKPSSSSCCCTSSSSSSPVRSCTDSGPALSLRSASSSSSCCRSSSSPVRSFSCTDSDRSLSARSVCLSPVRSLALACASACASAACWKAINLHCRGHPLPMAVEAIIKLLPDSSLCGHSASNIVGLVSVLAISGSVALFTFAAGKRTLAAIDDDAADAVSDSDSGEAGSSETACHASSPPSNAKDFAARKRVHFAEDVKEPCGDSRAYRLRSAQEARALRSVHFAEDVKEPCGDSREYRLRSAQEAQDLRSHCRSRSQMPANRLALYKGLRQYQREHGAMNLSY